MEKTIAVKVNQHIFCYPLVGFEKNLIYSTINRSIILADAKTGAPIKILEKDEDLDFADFILVARNMYLTILEYSN